MQLPRERLMAEDIENRIKESVNDLLVWIAAGSAAPEGVKQDLVNSLMELVKAEKWDIIDDELIGEIVKT
jgi:hypothetical protein